LLSFQPLPISVIVIVWFPSSVFRIYKTIILPLVLYGCKTLFLVLREEHRLSMFENRVLKRIFGSKRDEVTGGGENYITGTS
jgi:hypothetical protein